MIVFIAKRDGRVVPFDSKRIAVAMQKALESVNAKYSPDDLSAMEKDAVRQLEENCMDGNFRVTVEQAQDIAETVLMQHGFFDAAKSFIRYRDTHQRVRGIGKEVQKFASGLVSGSMGSLDITEFADPCQELDVIHNQNASTAGGTMGASILAESEAITKMWWYNLYDPGVREICQIEGGTGEIYIHDMGMAAPYCGGWDLKAFLTSGLSGVKNKISSAPPKHLSTACTQLVNFLGIMQNEWAGAQAVSSFDTYLAPFVKADNMDYKQVKQCIQTFVFGVNVSSRWGSQCPFTNITLDWTIPDDLKNMPAVVGGKEMDFTYGDCKKEMDMVNKAFLETMIAGDANGRGFQYPIPTYSITTEFDWGDNENNRLLFEYAAKYGGPYFSNYINSDMKPSDVRSMCCRLRLDLRELRKQNGGNFGAGENTGSIGVVTINLPHIAYNAKTEDEFFERLEQVMNIAARSLNTKRAIVTQYLDRENSAYPYTKAYLKEGFKNHFSTIGLVGMNEACLNAKWLGKDLTDKECLAWSIKVLDFMRNKLSDYQEEYGCLFNLEATPAESTCYTLARMDKKRYPGLISAGTDDSPYYTNSTHLPVGKIDDIFDALDMEDEMQIRYTSGTVFHAFLGERLQDWESAAKLVRTIAENYKLPYFTLSPTYSVCEDHGYITGEHDACPQCGKPTEIYSRITGYYRPVSNWNKGKTQEFRERKTYAMESLTKCNTGKVGEPASCGEAVSAKTLDILPDAVTILSTHTCPKCKMAKAQMDAKGIQYNSLYAEDSDGMELAKEYKIMNVPALFVTDDIAQEPHVITEFNEILAWIKAQ